MGQMASITHLGTQFHAPARRCSGTPPNDPRKACADCLRQLSLGYLTVCLVEMLFRQVIKNLQDIQVKNAHYTFAPLRVNAVATLRRETIIRSCPAPRLLQPKSLEGPSQKHKSTSGLFEARPVTWTQKICPLWSREHPDLATH